MARARKLTSRLRKPHPEEKKAEPKPQTPDIPLETLDRIYTPRQTSLNSSFRFSRAERERDQELVDGYTDERWNEEDRFTNKSGDPRIGTHHRKYE